MSSRETDVLRGKNTMKITFWDISQAAKLTDFYNEQIATVPYCYPVSPEEFERAVCYQLHEVLASVIDIAVKPWDDSLH